MIEKVLIAGRHLAALEAIRACRTLGVSSVALYRPDDAFAPYVRIADEAHVWAGDPELDAERLLALARRSNADAILATDARAMDESLATAARSAGLVWAGLPPATIRLLQDIPAFRGAAHGLGISVVPWAAVRSAEEACGFAEREGLPVILHDPHGPTARVSSFAGIERVLDDMDDAEWIIDAVPPGGTRIQVGAIRNRSGDVVALSWSTLAVGRRPGVRYAPPRHLSEAAQKLVVERSSDLLTTLGVVGSVVLEWIATADEQVHLSHAHAAVFDTSLLMTELTGTDPTLAQLAIGLDLHLPERPTRPPVASAVEYTVRAQHPSSGYLPTAGRIARQQLPGGIGVRVASALEEGAPFSGLGDTALLRILALGRDRAESTGRGVRALSELSVHGIAHDLSALRAVEVPGAELSAGQLGESPSDEPLPALGETIWIDGREATLRCLPTGTRRE